MLLNFYRPVPRYCSVVPANHDAIQRLHRFTQWSSQADRGWIFDRHRSRLTAYKFCIKVKFLSRDFLNLKRNVKKVVTTTFCYLPFYRETPAYYGQLYKKHNITRAHVIKLGPNNDAAAKEALASWPGETIDYVRL